MSTLNQDMAPHVCTCYRHEESRTHVFTCYRHEESRARTACAVRTNLEEGRKAGRQKGTNLQEGCVQIGKPGQIGGEVAHEDVGRGEEQHVAHWRTGAPLMSDAFNVQAATDKAMSLRHRQSPHTAMVAIHPQT